MLPIQRSQYIVSDIMVDCILWYRTSIQLEPKEHETEPCQQPQVSLADHSRFFLSGPCRFWIPSVSALVRFVRLERDMCAADFVGGVFREAVGCNKLRLRDRVLDWRTHRGLEWSHDPGVCKNANCLKVILLWEFCYIALPYINSPSSTRRLQHLGRA